MTLWFHRERLAFLVLAAVVGACLLGTSDSEVEPDMDLVLAGVRQPSLMDRYFELQQEQGRLRMQELLLRERWKEQGRIRRLLDLRDEFQEKGRTLVPALITRQRVLNASGASVDFWVAPEAGFIPLQNGIVMAPEGVAGRMYATEGGRPAFLPTVDQAFGMGIHIPRSGTVGVAQGDGPGRPLVASYLEKRGDIRNGDLVVTSDQGDIFPPDLPVGIVLRVEENTPLQTRRAYIQPFADWRQLIEVCVEATRPATTSGGGR